MARCLIGCGSNQGRRREHLDRAVELLRFMPGVAVVAVSRPRETRPVGGPAGQPAFLNSACLVETDLPPHDVLSMLAAVENTLHRERAERWGPRTIDLDLLLYDDAVIDSADLTLPHPRMTTRRFVLEPCAEIAPDFVHPLAGCTLKALLANVSQPHPHIAVVGVPGAGAPEVADAVADATLARLVHAPAHLPAQAFEFPATNGHAGNWEDAWLRPLADCAAPLATTGWPRDPHGTVVDFWLESYVLAAEESLPAHDRDRLRSEFAKLAATSVAPTVAILLVASPEALEERITFRSRRPPPQSDIFADLQTASTAVAGEAETDVAATVRGLLHLQEKMVCRLRTPEGNARFGPKSVVVIPSDDLGQAALDAVAAVEAMA